MIMFRFQKLIFPVLLMATIVSSLSLPACAQLLNSGFETGDLTGWTTQGNVEVLQASNFAPMITPPAGNFFALLSTGPGGTTGNSGVDLDGDTNNDWDVTTLSQTFTSQGVPLSFSWSWLTSEDPIVISADDFFLVRLDGNVILSGSVDVNILSPLPNVPTDGMAYTVTSPGATGGSVFDEGRSNFQTFTLQITAGSHTIEFLVADNYDYEVDSGLLINMGAPPPVGGVSMPLNKLTILSPYIALAAAVMAMTAIILIVKRR